MNVAVHVEFKADRKEPLGGLIRRVTAQFEQSGLQPDVLATFSDGPPGVRVTSAVERALKKHPHLAHLERNDAPLPGAGIPPIRRLTNSDGSNRFPITDVLNLADGVPRSLPFNTVNVHFGHPDFGTATFPIGLAPRSGIAISDGWWITGRLRSLSAFYAVDAAATSKKLPDPPATVAAMLAGFGKPKKTAQFVAPAADAGGLSIPPEIALISPIVAKYRSGMQALVERIGLPHDLPSAADARLTSFGASGPLKPTLVEAFKPRGYSCRGESGTFSLRRRTAANHVVELYMDVGTWSRSLTLMFHVHGPGFNATLMPPVTVRGHTPQYPIGDTENWERIVANAAAIVDELERTFVVEIEAAVGPAPEWFEPGR